MATNYNNLSHEQLMRELLSRDRQLGQLRQELHTNVKHFAPSPQADEYADEIHSFVARQLSTLLEDLPADNPELPTKSPELFRLSETMRNLSAATGIEMLFVDPQLRLSYYTPAVVSVFNVTPDDISRPLGSIVSGMGCCDRLTAKVQTVLATRMPHEAKIQTAAGIGYSLRIAPYCTMNNTVAGALLVFTDISERKRLEERLRESDALLSTIRASIDIAQSKQPEKIPRRSRSHLQAIVDTVNSGIITINEQGLVTTFNPAAERIFGYTETEILGRNIKELMPPTYREHHDGYLASYIKTGNFRLSDHAREVLGQRKGGSTFPMSLRIGEFFDGDTRFFTGIVEDISARKMSEMALRESEERLAYAMDASGEGVWDWDIVSNRAIHNQKWFELLGLQGDNSAYTPKFFTTLLHEDDQAAVLARIRQALDSGGHYRSEHRLRKSDGTFIWVLEQGSVVKRDAQGRPLRMVGSFADISGRKRAEQKLREHQNHYERLLKLEVASQTVTAIAHELNQPLNAAASYIDAALRYLQAGNPKPEQLTLALEHSEQQIQRSGQIIHELCRFLRNEDTITECFDLNEAVSELLDNIELDGQLNGFSVSVELTKKLPLVRANKIQVQKVLNVLLRNSIEAMQDSGLEHGFISVAVRPAERQGFAQVTVSDNGPGLDAEARQRLFQPFFSTKPKGLGIGLALSRAMVKAQGGELWAGQQNGPAVFHFTLPFAHEASS